jgi:L-lactate dehydrogenase complex protein LldG
MDAREEILSRIREALEPGERSVVVPREYRTAGEHAPGSGALVELFTDRLVDYKAAVVPTADADPAAAVAGVLAERGLRRVVAPDGVPAAWLAGAEALREPLTVADLDAADAVVTGCAAAVAETGTIVLDGGADQGRRALTLVPDVHVVVVRPEQVVQTVPEALARLDPARPLTMISGPSATSDIELDRVEGVHGPRTLVVVLPSAAPSG